MVFHPILMAIYVNRLPIFDSDDVFHCIASEVLKKNRTKTLASS